ncbi:MAG: hypothetical protein LQ343_001407 [Gyalolechia ehrenbergii]|nr:MAG: hypothetical protein LQ343_001407 [Gyalolechia ehrenbergii]
MLRPRRSSFASFGTFEGGDGSHVEDLKTFGPKDSSSKPVTESTPAAEVPTASREPDGKDLVTKEDSDKLDSDELDGIDKSLDTPIPDSTSVAATNEPVKHSSTSAIKKPGASPQGQDFEEPKDLQNITKFDGEPDTVGQGPAEPAVDTSATNDGEGRLEVTAGPDHDTPKIHWSQLPEHFPIPTKSLIPLPTGKPKAIPKIQFAKFPDESSDQKVEREAKLDQIKKTFAFSWDGYRKNAWMHDELSPVSGKYRDPFCGWAATLVDSLDSLWMLGMKQEFEKAAEAVVKIDFTTTTRHDLPLFEVTIRYLGGLIAAYDISGSKYRILLDKAVELADVLMGAFDTPNRMPMTYYLWKPTFASQPHRAKTRVVLAEIGSLSLEFTRLAQITKEAKYYDAIARITDEFERWQNDTKIPGLWPKHVDASGCKKLDSSDISPVAHSVQKGPGFYNEQFPQLPKANKASDSDQEEVSEPSKALKKDILKPGTATESSGNGMEKRQVPESELAAETAKPKADCVAQGLSSPPGSSWENFTIGGMADSVYEYLPKEYMLLGGLEEKYQSMYEKAANATVNNLIFRPMIEDEKRNILVAGEISTSGKLESKLPSSKLKPEHTHLTCFAGGMFAVGARIFDRKDDMDIAKRLTDGCVWAYEMTPTGIMPERFLITPCEDVNKCPFNETVWYKELDTYHPRAQSPSDTQQVPLSDSTASSWQAAAGISKAKLHATQSSTVHEGADSTEVTASNLMKRQLGDIEHDKPMTQDKEKQSDESEVEVKISKAATFKQNNGTESDGEGDTSKDQKPANESVDVSEAEDIASPTRAEEGSRPVVPAVEAYNPPPLPSQEKYALDRIRDEKLPKGVTKLTRSDYILRPEAVESVFIMYRVTGDDYWRQKGWNMFTSIRKYTLTEYGASAISNVMSEKPDPLDTMESFWLAETLKYLYLLFCEPDYYSLDDYVLYVTPMPHPSSLNIDSYRNTEAHPFKRPK